MEFIQSFHPRSNTPYILHKEVKRIIVTTNTHLLKASGLIL